MPPFAIRSLAAAATFATLTLPATASTVSWSVEGDVGGAPVLGSAVVSPGVAQSFTVNETLTDARIGLEMFCLPSCDVTLYLINGLPGPGFGVSQLETRRDFSGAGSFAYDLVPRSVGWNSLMAGVTYSLVLSLTAGDGFWRSVRNAVASGPEVTLGGAFLIASPDDFDSGAPPASIFEPWTTSTPRFTITGTADRPPVPVPLPASLPLLAGALLMLRRRRT